MCPARQGHSDPGESSSTQAQESQQRGCDSCTLGETLCCQLDKSQERGDAEAGREQFVHSDIINLHLGLISFGIEIFFLTAGISHLCLFCTKTRDCWPSL